MLFPAADDVARVWAVVAQDTIEGRLGTGAKVATDDGSGRRRLVCVYTTSFLDGGDVRRVLLQLVARGLVDPASPRHGIFYKTDAYTYLDVYNDNDFGLKASLYASRDMLAPERAPARRR